MALFRVFRQNVAGFGRRSHTAAVERAVIEIGAKIGLSLEAAIRKHVDSLPWYKQLFRKRYIRKNLHLVHESDGTQRLETRAGEVLLVVNPEKLADPMDSIAVQTVPGAVEYILDSTKVANPAPSDDVSGGQPGSPETEEPQGQD